ncbi:MAG: tetratricopeptide repeat-containing sensor histidine kinase [Bacteroidia bacterium]
MKKIRILFSFLFLLPLLLVGQTNSIQDTNAVFISNTNNTNNTTNLASTNLLNAIGTQKNNEEIARNYSEVAESLVQAGDLQKAEVYCNKAIQVESVTAAKKNLAAYYRQLARIQELQNKFSISSESYSKAAGLSKDSIEKNLNKNDALRLRYKLSPKEELLYLNQNAVILNNTNNQAEKVQNLTQMASANIALNQTEPALANYREALSNLDSTSVQAVLIKSNIVDLMAASQDFTEAIALQKQLVKQARENSNIEVRIIQLRNLAALYFKIDSIPAGLALLHEAYTLAIDKGSLAEAKKSLAALTTHYSQLKQPEQAAQLYNTFISNLDNILARDSSLIDKKLFLINEGKIVALEQQQILKDELIARKNRYSLFLIGFIILLGIVLLLSWKAWMSIRKRNKQIALQSLRREMNPHFIFNSLNSINQFIANNNEREANKYLTSYSGLMRNIMENSNKDYVSLATEIDQLKKYLELERMRFPDKFNYAIEIDPTLVADQVMVPNMLIQPNLENAIWHGLRYKESAGMLLVTFKSVDKRIQVSIDDNGIGLTASKNMKTKNQKLHESLGLKNVEERIRLLNAIYKTDIRFDLTEKSGSSRGVLVQLTW